MTLRGRAPAGGRTPCLWSSPATRCMWQISALGQSAGPARPERSSRVAAGRWLVAPERGRPVMAVVRLVLPQGAWLPSCSHGQPSSMGRRCQSMELPTQLTGASSGQRPSCGRLRRPGRHRRLRMPPLLPPPPRLLRQSRQVEQYRPAVVQCRASGAAVVAVRLPAQWVWQA